MKGSGTQNGLREPPPLKATLGLTSRIKKTEHLWHKVIFPRLKRNRKMGIP